MATALDIIKRARRMLNALGVGETLETELANDGLEALNAMLDSWSIDSHVIYAIRSNTFNLTGAASYTVGTGGNFSMTRPDRIESAFVTVSGNDYQLDILDTDQWNLISNKNTESTTPSCIKYDPFMPLATLSVYPKGNDGTITLNTLEPLQQFTNLTETVSLPRGYERALASCLAVEISPEVNRPISRELMGMAIASKSAIMRINAAEPILMLDSALSGRGTYGNILTG